MSRLGDERAGLQGVCVCVGPDVFGRRGKRGSCKHARFLIRCVRYELDHTVDMSVCRSRVMLGTYTDANAATACVPCATGYVSQYGRTSCVMCLPGTVSTYGMLSSRLPSFHLPHFHESLSGFELSLTGFIGQYANTSRDDCSICPTGRPRCC